MELLVDKTRRFAIVLLGLFFAVGGALDSAAVERTEPLGRMRGRFIPFPSDESVRRVFSIHTDSQGRVIAANGRIGIYDGHQMRELPTPSGVHTGALAVDGQDRVWVGNHEDIGYFVETADGWVFTSVKPELPAGVTLPEIIWSVHCVGETVFFVGSHQVLVRTEAGIRLVELPGLRRLFASVQGQYCYVWQRGQDRTQLWRLDVEGDARVVFSVPEFFGAYDVLRVEGEEIEFIGEWASRVVVRDGAIVRIVHHRGPEMGAISAILLPDGSCVVGTAAQGVRRIDREGRELWAADVSTGDLNDHAAEAVALGRGGVVWSVSALGITGLEVVPAVTTFVATDGAPSGVNAILRVDGRLHVATSTGVFQLMSGGGSEPARFEKISKQGQFAYDIHHVPNVGLLMAGQNVHRLQEYDWPISGQMWGMGRSLFTLSARPDWLLFAQTDQVLVRAMNPTDADRPWPMLWSVPVKLLDRAFPLPGLSFLWSDLAGRVERRDLRVEGAGLVSAEPARLTSAEGIGRIVRFEAFGDDVLAFTRDAVWRSRGGADAFERLPTDAPAGVLPFAFIWETESEGWGVAALRATAGSGSSGGHALWRVARTAGGAVVGFAYPPHAFFEGIGLLTCAWRERETWWLGGSAGVARVELRWLAERRPLSIGEPPRLRGMRESGGTEADLAASATLAASRQLEVEWAGAPHEHGMPLWIETRLEPIEREWTALSGQPRQRYPSLPAGHYRLVARAVDAAGTRGPETAREFRVQPRFRESWLFPASLALAMGAVAAVLWISRTRQLRSRRAALERTVAERTAALQVANEELHRLNKRRVEFVGTVSHELRTPLAGARMMADQMIRRPEAEAARQLRRCLNDLEQMLEGSLDLSRYELGLIPVQLRWVRVTEWLSDAVVPFRVMAREKGLEFALQLSVRAKLLLVDEPNLRRVLANLVSNAIKYTSAGSITLAAQEDSDSPANGLLTRLRLTVRDTGRGLSQEQQQSLFAEFKRVAWSDGDSNGHGLGLVLTRQLVEVSGGQLTCESSPGAGAAFTVDLPAVASDAEEPEPPFPTEVLVVEDEDSHAAHAADVMEPLGATVHRVRSVAEFVAWAGTGRADLALIDFNLPDGTGLEILEKLMSRASRPRCVLLSSIRSEEMRALCLERGFDSVWPKPLSVGAAIAELWAARDRADQNFRATETNHTRPSES